MSRRDRFVLAALLGCVVAAVAHAQAHRGVASVIDGDTLEIHGQRFRLHGIDAPESRQTCRDGEGQIWRCGQQAALALSDRIGRRTVTCRQTDIDRYQRIVAVCRLGEESLNAWLVRQGYAMAYRRYSTAYVDEEAAARRAKAGIWQGEFVPPWAWRRGERLEEPTSTTSPSRSATTGRDRDCSDFRGWREAQDFYERSGPGDPHRLDGDKDGIACEGLKY